MTEPSEDRTEAMTGAATRSSAVHAQEITDTTLADIEAQFSDSGDGVWISPAFARKHGISAADEKRIEQAVADTEATDLRVLLVDVASSDARFTGNYSQLVSWIQDDIGGEALYVGWNDYDEAIKLHGVEFDDGSYYVDRLAALDAPGDAVGQLEKASELLDAGNAYELWTALDDDEKYGSPDGDGSNAVGITVGVLIAAVFAVAILARWAARRREKRGPGTQVAGARGKETFALPTTVLRTVRAAEDRSLRRRADTEIQALGERLVGQELDDLDGVALGVWEQAMEHHEVARRVLDQGRTPADVVGALVLARRGEDAREAAVAGREWAPEPGCWFNPLHEGPTTTVAWTDTEDARKPRKVDVPACGDCAKAVRKGQEPADVLDFVEGEKVVHYYRLDIGVWSRTGYGSLETDLVGALHLGRRGRSGRFGRRG